MNTRICSLFNHVFVFILVFVLWVSVVLAGPVVNWNVKKLVVTVGNGTLPLSNQVIAFTSNKDIKNAELWVVPELQPYIKVIPSHFDMVEANKAYEVQFQFTLPYDAVPGRLVDGTIHLVSNSKTNAKPLPVEIKVDFGDIVISENTRVLSPETIQALISVSEDYSEYIFSSLTPQLETLKPGDIIVIGYSELTPDGTIGRVSGISISGNEVRIRTTVAALEDVIRNGTIEFLGKLKPDASADLVLDNKSKLSSIEPQGIYIELHDFVLIDLDGDGQTTYDQLVLNGFWSIAGQIEVKIQIQNSTIRYFRFLPGLVVSQQLEALARMELLSFNKSLSLPLPIKGGSFVIMVGPVPLVFSVGISIFINGEGSVYAGLESTVASRTTGQLGLEYVNQQFSPIVSVNTEYEFEPISPTAGAELKASVGAELSLKLYWVVGPYVTADKYLLLEADIFDDPWWRLFGGRELYGGFKADVPLFRTLFDWQFPLRYGERRLLASAPTGGEELLETLIIPSNGVPVYSKNYSSTNSYRIEVSGTYIWGGCDSYYCPGGGPCNYKRWGDAEWLTDNCWGSVDGDFYNWDISVYVDGQDVNWGSYNEQHVYSIYKNGNNNPFGFHINDCPHCYGDNSGYLTVKIYSAN